MALRHLFSRVGKARALGLAAKVSSEGASFTQRTTQLVGGTSGHCWNDTLQGRESCQGEEGCLASSSADSRPSSFPGSGVSECIEGARFSRHPARFGGTYSKPPENAPISSLPEHIPQGFASHWNPTLASTHICQTFVHVRHNSNAAVNAEPHPNLSITDVDPSIAIHREQFLRASNRKVEKPQPVIRAYMRELVGKNPNKKERKQGLVPGIVFSSKGGHKGGDKRLISVGHKQLSAILQPLGKFFFSAMTWDLEVYEGRPGEEATAKKTVERVVPKSVHLHAATDEPMNVTFMRVFPEEKIIVDVPLVFLGEDACPGLKKGGRLNTLRRLVRYECPGDKIPPYLEVDISTLNVGQSVRLKDLPAYPALRLTLKDPDWLVVKISGRTQEEESST